MTTAIIGVGNIGTTVARNLVDGGERVVLAAREGSHATALANELGELASAASVEEAITYADVVLFAVWLGTLKELIAQHGDLLRSKVVVDPSNPVAQDANGEIVRTLPNDESSRRPATCTSSEDCTGTCSTTARRARPSRRPHDGPRPCLIRRWASGSSE